MAVDPKKLQALVQRENQKQPITGGGDQSEDEGGAGDEGDDAAEGAPVEDEFYIELNERELADIAQMVEDGEGDDDLYEKARQLAVMVSASEEAGVDSPLPPDWVASPSIWDKATAAVDPEGEGAKYEEPWCVVAHIFKRMGGRFNK